MAITFHAISTGVTNTVAGTSATTTSLVVTAGDLIVAAIATVGTAVSAVSDGINTYVRCAGPATNTVQIQAWSARAKTSTTIATITATIGSSRNTMIAASYTNVPQISELKGTGTGSTTPITEANTTADPGDFEVLVGSSQGVGTYSASVGSLRGSLAGGGSTTPGVCIADNTNASAGASVTVSVSITANTTWGAAMLELRTVPFLSYINVGQTQPVINPIQIVDY